jgi:hypothetical protein
MPGLQETAITENLPVSQHFAEPAPVDLQRQSPEAARYYFPVYQKD